MSRKQNDQPSRSARDAMPPPVALAFDKFFPGVLPPASARPGFERPNGPEGASLYRSRGAAVRVAGADHIPSQDGSLLAQLYAEGPATDHDAVLRQPFLELESCIDEENGPGLWAFYNTGEVSDDPRPLAIQLNDDGSASIIVDVHESDPEKVELTFDELRNLIRSHPRYRQGVGILPTS